MGTHYIKNAGLVTSRVKALIWNEYIEPENHQMGGNQFWTYAYVPESRSNWNWGIEFTGSGGGSRYSVKGGKTSEKSVDLDLLLVALGINGNSAVKSDARKLFRINKLAVALEKFIADGALKTEKAVEAIDRAYGNKSKKIEYDTLYTWRGYKDGQEWTSTAQGILSLKDRTQGKTNITIEKIEIVKK